MKSNSDSFFWDFIGAMSLPVAIGCITFAIIYSWNKSAREEDAWKVSVTASLERIEKRIKDLEKRQQSYD